jgi:hypothetical protein
MPHRRGVPRSAYWSHSTGHLPRDFDVIDLHCPCDLHHDLVEKSLFIGALTRNSAQIDKNADMPPDLVQRRPLLFVCFLRHGRYS